MNANDAFMRTLDRGLEALRASNARFALIGGLAVSVRCEPRFTKDADFVVAVRSPAEAEQLGATMLGHGFVLDALFERTDIAQIATMRFIRDEVYVDLLTGSCGAEAEIVTEATEMAILGGRRCAVVTVGALLALKALACSNRRKPDDTSDMQRLLAVATSADVQNARRLAGLMVQRKAPGAHRIEGILAAAHAYYAESRPGAAAEAQ